MMVRNNSFSSNLNNNIVTILNMIALLLFLSILVMQLYWPFNVDQGMFSFVGSVIVDGGVPYKDAWEVKGPIVHFIYAISEAIFGNKYVSIRIFDLFIVIISSFFLYKILSNNNQNDYALFLVCCYGISFFPDNWASAQPDGWVAMILPIIYYLMKSNSADYSKSKSISIGILLCIISFIKPFYILFFFVLLPLLVTNKSNRKELFSQLLLISLGVTMCLLALLAYLLKNDGLQDFIDIFILFNINTHKYVSVGGIEEINNSLFSFFISYERVVFLLLSSIGFLWILKHQNGDKFAYLMWILFAVTCVIFQGKYIYYQFFIFIPIMFIFVGYLFQEIETKFGKKPLIFLMILILIFITSNKDRIWYINQLVKYAGGSLTQQQYYNKFPIVGKDKDAFNSSVNDIVNISKYLRKNSIDDDTMQVWGLESVIYFLSGVKPATKFGHLYPFVVGSENSKNLYRKQFIEKIITVRPKYIIVANNDSNSLIRQTSKQHMLEFIEFNNFVNSNYIIDRKFGDYEIYKIN